MTRHADGDLEGPGELRPIVFTITWAAAHVMHTATHAHGRLTDPTQAAVFLAALAAAARPRSERLLALLAIVQIIDWASYAPHNPDHWTLVLAVNTILLLGLVRSRFSSVKAPLVEANLTGIRLALLVGYGAAALAKWNTTFLTPATSCAAELMGMASFGLLEDFEPARALAVTVAVLCETATFLLLLFPATRSYGVRLGLLFHSAVSLSPVMVVSDFTATVSALFLLFLPRTELMHAVDWLRSSNSDSPGLAWLRRHPWFVPLGLLAVGGVLGFVSDLLFRFIFWALATVYQVGCILVPVLRTRKGAFERPPSKRLAPALPAIAFLLFTAANPYLGLRTTGAFTMFSNLRTEAGTNSLVVRAAPVFDYQAELFDLTASSDPYLEDAIDHDEDIPLSSMYGWSRTSSSSAWVEGELDGTRVRFTASEADTVLGEPSAFKRYFLSFRPVDPDNPNPRCGN